VGSRGNGINFCRGDQGENGLYCCRRDQGEMD